MTDKYAEIRARAVALNTLGAGTPEFAADPVIEQAADDLFTLLADVERLRGSVEVGTYTAREIEADLANARAENVRLREALSEVDGVTVSQNTLLRAKVRKAEAERDMLRKGFRSLHGVAPTSEHHPVGAYLPVGQLDGDCSCGDTQWPCAALTERAEES